MDMEWSCQAMTKLAYRHQTLRTLSKVPAWKEEKLKLMAKEYPCRIVIASEDPDGLRGINMEKMQKASIATYPIVKPYRDAIESMHQWTIAAVPSAAWAKKVFPGLKKNQAIEALWKAILESVHVSDDADEEQGTESDSFFYMADGSLTVTSGDDGIHADASVIIEGGTVLINESYEGIEGLSISISGGSTTLTATDDGLNAAGGNASSGSQTFGSDDWGGGFPGGGMNDGGTNGSIVISGGNVKITAGGDGIDSNGSLEISGGYTVVEGPTQGDTSVLDFNSTGTITGGTFIGTGGAGMASNFTSADQGVIAVSVGEQAAGSSVKLTNSSGDVIAEVTPGLNYAVVYVSTQDMAQGETYTLTAGSYSESITLTDNLYSTLNGGMRGSFGGGGPRGGMNEDAGGNMDGGMNGDMNSGMQNAPDGMQRGNGFGGHHGGHGRNGGQVQGDTDGITGATELQDNSSQQLQGDTAA